ncbi:Hypothetical protein R9X50_00755600 [Acrodontium crateriforme]|uniref:Gem-associated protein 5 TPR domain-containing protein n=1 Tax=Acrodontium crateriforme TaxID=150365 RepID=A0AAQ3RE77_9PEZI|nr:Hypothetical protein R9X50_00755600 [Acrodontium crateriforme]
MSIEQRKRQPSHSSTSSNPSGSYSNSQNSSTRGQQHSQSSGKPHKPNPPQTSLTPENVEQEFLPCAATASFFLYSQRNTILVIHHDTLAIERRFDLHREDVLWISVDNTSERGSGRLAVSYDAGNTAIVWDILTGGEVARFAAYERMKVGIFMRNGNIAFGNDQGNIILFEPSTSEHISSRTIFDPITAIAPSSDCRTFAIGYLNGSILIATLQPSFTIQHTLTTTRAPSRITGLAWHGTSSKQRSDMLATQTLDGDLRVWSVPKVPFHEPPNIIRLLQRSEFQQPGPCWFSWSKTGRIVQLAEGETRAWDVRTKKVTFETIPTVDGIIGIAVYGPTATLFTLGRSHTVQQYDITPTNEPMQVASAQHVPANTPPTPPTVLDEQKNPYASQPRAPPILPLQSGSESSADERNPMSPLQRIAKEMDAIDTLQSELRDQVMPLSPTASSNSSMSSRSSAGGRKGRKYLYDRPDSSRASNSTGFEGTEFSFGGPASLRQGHDGMSVRSVSSYQSRPATRSSRLRKEILRSPEEENVQHQDLFAFTRARLREVPFRTPHYGTAKRTPELLQREMLSVVFGWNEDARSLIHDEMTRHGAATTCGVLLSKWMGEIAADDLASKIGSQSMTSSDWMILALSSIGASSQKNVGEAFVQRLLEKGDVHPAVAILLGLGENNDAVEVYVSQGYWLEAVLLTCLKFPSDWVRQSFLLRRWGEAAVQQGQAELAVRCFSCTSVETSEPWFSPRAKDAFYFAQQIALSRDECTVSVGALNSPPLSPPSRSASGRLKAKNASLKLITSFDAQRDTKAPRSAIAGDPTPMVAGATPIAESALSPSGGRAPWHTGRGSRTNRDPSSARTATPGGYSRRTRLPSIGEIERARHEITEMSTPMTAAREFGPTLATGHTSHHERRSSNVSPVPGSAAEPMTAVRPTAFEDRMKSEEGSTRLPTPSQSIAARLRESSRPRERSRARAEGLAVQVVETRYDRLTPDITTGTTEGSSVYSRSSGTVQTTRNKPSIGATSPVSSSTTSRSRAIDQHISSVEEARRKDRSRPRTESRRRDDSRIGRTNSRRRDQSAQRGQDAVYIKPPKRSPSSPVPMSPQDVANASQRFNTTAEPATMDDESFYKVVSPISPSQSRDTLRSPMFEKRQERRPSSRDRSAGHLEGNRGPRVPSRRRRDTENNVLEESTSRGDRGRSARRTEGALTRSPSSPLPLPQNKEVPPVEQPEEARSDSHVQSFRLRSRSTSQKPGDELQARRAARNTRDRSESRKRIPRIDEMGSTVSGVSGLSSDLQSSEVSSYTSSSLSESRPRLPGMSRKELAARELEERRLSLARRPSAPAIPLPSELPNGFIRPKLSPRSQTDLSKNPFSSETVRNHTNNPDVLGKNVRQHKHASSMSNVNTQQLPAITMGLPATPRAMRHPRYMHTSEPDHPAPPVPEIPGNFSELSSQGSSLTSSSLSHATGSNLSQHSFANHADQPERSDDIGPLLPSTVYNKQAIRRSVSAPPENGGGAPVHPAYRTAIAVPSANFSGRQSHTRKISPPEIKKGSVEISTGRITSIDEALNDIEPQVIIIPGTGSETPADSGSPVLLPELQHLAGPPPPPPPPTMFQHPAGVINVTEHLPEIGVAAGTPSNMLPATTFAEAQSLPQPMERSTTSSPHAHRRGQRSIDNSFSARFRGVTDRMRSTSRSRGKSPLEGPKAPPYESILPMSSGHGHQESISRPSQPFPPMRRESFSRAKSPYEQAMADQQMPPPPPPPPGPHGVGTDDKFHDTNLPAVNVHLPQSSSNHRNLKDVRANMPPDTLQHGVYMGGAGYL